MLLMIVSENKQITAAAISHANTTADASCGLQSSLHTCRECSTLHMQQGSVTTPGDVPRLSFHHSIIKQIWDFWGERWITTQTAESLHIYKTLAEIPTAFQQLQPCSWHFEKTELHSGEDFAFVCKFLLPYFSIQEGFNTSHLSLRVKLNF